MYPPRATVSDLSLNPAALIRFEFESVENQFDPTCFQFVGRHLHPSEKWLEKKPTEIFSLTYSYLLQNHTLLVDSIEPNRTKRRAVFQVNNIQLSQGSKDTLIQLVRKTEEIIDKEQAGRQQVLLRHHASFLYNAIEYCFRNHPDLIQELELPSRETRIDRAIEFYQMSNDFLEVTKDRFKVVTDSLSDGDLESLMKTCKGVFFRILEVDGIGQRLEDMRSFKTRVKMNLAKDNCRPLPLLKEVIGRGYACHATDFAQSIRDNIVPWYNGDCYNGYGSEIRSQVVEELCNKKYFSHALQLANSIQCNEIRVKSLKFVAESLLSDDRVDEALQAFSKMRLSESPIGFFLSNLILNPGKVISALLNPSSKFKGAGLFLSEYRDARILVAIELAKKLSEQKKEEQAKEILLSAERETITMVPYSAEKASSLSMIAQGYQDAGFQEEARRIFNSINVPLPLPPPVSNNVQ